MCRKRGELPSAARRATLRFGFVALYVALRLRSTSRFPTADRSDARKTIPRSFAFIAYRRFGYLVIDAPVIGDFRHANALDGGSAERLVLILLARKRE